MTRIKNRVDVTHIDLLRHGKLETSGLFCASPDTALSKMGMNSLLQATEKGCWDVIISSPHRRCLEFAEMLARNKSCKLVLEPDFKEMNFGDWVNKPSKELLEQAPDLFEQLWQSPENFIAPNGESVKAFIQRVESGWNRLLSNHKGSSLLLITHAGVIRAILSKTLKISATSVLPFNIGHAQFTCLNYYSDGVYSLESLGLRKISDEV